MGGYCQSVELLEDELEEAGYLDLVQFQIACSKCLFLLLEIITFEARIFFSHNKKVDI